MRREEKKIRQLPRVFISFGLFLKYVKPTIQYFPALIKPFKP